MHFSYGLLCHIENIHSVTPHTCNGLVGRGYPLLGEPPVQEVGSDQFLRKFFHIKL